MTYPRAFTTLATAIASPAIKNVNWGILSAGKISNDFCQAIRITEGATASCVAARAKDSAQIFADKHNIEKVHDCYESLVKDPEVDVVYIGSVADSHAKLAKMCLDAKKPVVVEKPLALNLDDAQELVAMARKHDVFLMEGMWSRFFPAMKKARELVDNGAIGEPVMVQADFGWNTKDCTPEDRMWNRLSGGMTYDIAMYCAMLGQVGFRGASVNTVNAICSNYRNGMEQTVLANILFDKVGGVGMGALQFYVTGQANTEERTIIQGTTGRITIAPPAHTPHKLTVNYDTGRGESKEEVMEYPLPDDTWADWFYPGSIGFTYQIEAVNECIRKGKKECETFTLDDSLQLAYLMDEILEQAGHEGFIEAKAIRQKSQHKRDQGNDPVSVAA